MEKINRDNYEAYFLDFAEGTLSVADSRALEIFLDAHPELREELANFENISLEGKDDLPGADWKGLKKSSLSDLVDDISARENLYFSAMEGSILPAEARILQDLLAIEIFKAEFSLWQKARLRANSEEAIVKDPIYQFGLDKPLSSSTYEAHLTALSEGLLDAGQIAQLKSFAERLPSGKKDLAIANNLRLKPALGIFYPDKKLLYKKENKSTLFWVYRATGVAAALLVAFLLWTVVGDNNSALDQSIAEKVIPIVENDTTKTVESESDTESDSTKNLPAGRIVKPNLKEWEVREPDPVEYAESTKPAREKITRTPEIEVIESLETPESEIQIAAYNPVADDENLEYEVEVPEGEDEVSGSLAEQPSPKYLSFGELAEQKIKKSLDVDVVERDAMALALAKKLTEKASQLVDAEVSREGSTSASGDESLTYTVRLGSFKVSHIKSK